MVQPTAFTRSFTVHSCLTSFTPIEIGRSSLRRFSRNSKLLAAFVKHLLYRSLSTSDKNVENMGLIPNTPVSTACNAPISTKHKNSTLHYVDISYFELHPNRSRSLGVTSRCSLTSVSCPIALSTVWPSAAR